MTANFPTRKAKQIQRRRANKPKYQTPNNGGREHSLFLRIHDELTKSLIQLMADRADTTETPGTTP